MKNRKETCKRDDEQCHNCIHSWWNMNAVEEEGWCYMFRDRVPNCQKWKPSTLDNSTDGMDDDIYVPQMNDKEIRN